MSFKDRDTEYVPEDDCKDPDYVPELSTVDIKDLASEGSSEEERRPRPIHIATDFGQEKYNNPDRHSNVYKAPPKPKKDRRTSMLWTKFTITNKKDKIATCNLCDQRMSIRSTSHNLKKHLERKHGYKVPKCFTPKKFNEPKYITPTPRPKLSELAGISEDGITLKVVGENGEEEHFQVIGEQFIEEEVVQEDVQEHSYSMLDPQTGLMVPAEPDPTPPVIAQVRSLREPRSSQPKRDLRPERTFASFLDEKSKRQRILDLQMECLENKKYNMQLEALLMEQQLSLPRSMFTDTLHYRDVQTIGTQTEVGGSDTRVFYISDKRNGRPIQQLFAYQDLDL